MTQKRKRRTNKKKSNSSRSKQQLQLLGGALAIILMIISLHTESAGFLGRGLKNLILTLFGLGGYVFPYFLIAISFLYFLKRDRIEGFVKSLVAFSVIYLSLLSLIDLALYSSVEYSSIVDKVSSAGQFGRMGFGGGMVGGLVSYATSKLIGRVGSMVLNVFLIAGVLIFVSDTDVASLGKEILERVRKFKDRKSQNKKVGHKIKKTSPSKTVDKKTYSDRELKILEADTNQGEKSNPHVGGQTLEEDEEIEKTQKMDLREIEKSGDKDEFSSQVAQVDKVKSSAPYAFPPLSFLSDRQEGNGDERALVKENAKKLMETLSNFGIDAEIDQVSIGPSISKYEIKIAPGVKVNRIVNLSNDIALSLASSDIRIEAPIPGKSAIGIEVPNKHKTGVNLKEILSSSQFQESESKLPIGLGKSVEGENIVADIEKMPHMLIAGATGSGKSVCINTIITSILYKSSPEDVKLILIDPKVVELSIYNGIPHLLTPVVTNPKKAPNALSWAVEEMNKRYNLFAESSVRDIKGYNKKQDKIGGEKLPKIVIIIDELSDLMMVSSSEVEDLICRIAQMARAAGIHLILATQRPSVDVITGTIKANIPSRISFAVSSQTDSRTILDMGGAEKLLGRGDMLYYPAGSSKPSRVQGAFIDDSEVETIVEFVKSNSKVEFKEELVEELERESDYDGECDELLPKAIEIVVNDGHASVSLLQRKLKVGYARAARIVDQMEERGIVEGHQGSKPRKVIVEREDIE